MKAFVSGFVVKTKQQFFCVCLWLAGALRQSGCDMQRALGHRMTKTGRERVCDSDTYHHLIDGIHYVVHLVARDISIIVHVVQSKRPWKTHTELIWCIGHNAQKNSKYMKVTIIFFQLGVAIKLKVQLKKWRIIVWPH